MDLVTVLVSVLVVVATIAAAVGIWALRELGGAAKSVRRLSDDAHERFIPLLEKADVTVDAVNAELLRVDILVTRFEDVADRVSQTATTLHEIANAPERIAGGIAEKVRAWRGRRSATPESRADTPDAPPISEDEADASASVPADDDQHASEDQWQQIG